ncbi:hypothetical protein ILYODFUR_028718, partial [Ilyodon furcidens]
MKTRPWRLELRSNIPPGQQSSADRSTEQKRNLRECITLSLKSSNQCPQCRATVPTDRMDFTTNHILKSLAEKAKETQKIKHSE